MNFNVKYIFHLVDKFSNRAKKMAASANQATGRINRMGAAFARMEQRIHRTARAMRNLRTIGRGLKSHGLGGGLITGTIGFLTGRTLLQFEEQMNTVEAIMGASQGQMKEIRAEAIRLGETTKFTAIQAAQGFTELARAGIKARQSIGMMGPTLDLAAAANIDLGMATDIVTNISKTFGQHMSELPGMVDLLSQAVTNTNFDLIQLAESIKYAGPVAANFKTPISQVLAVTMALAQGGIKASTAGTGLARVIEGMVTPSNKASAALSKIGINMNEFFDKSGRITDLIGIVERFGQAQKEFGRKTTSEAILRTFGKRGGRIMLSAVARGTAEMREFAEILGQSEGRAKKMRDIMMQGLPGAVYKLIAAMQSLILTIGDSGLTKDLIAIANALRDAAKWFKSLDPATQKWAARLGLLAAGISLVLFPLGIFALAIAALVPIFAALSGPIGLTVMGITALGVAVAAYASDIKAFFAGFGGQIASDWAATVEQYQGYWDSFISFLESIPSRLAGIGQAIAQALSSIVPTSSGWEWLDRQLGLASEAAKPASGSSDTAAASSSVTEGKLDITSRVETKVTAPPSVTLYLPDGTLAGKIPLGATAAPKGQNMPATPGTPAGSAR